MSSNNNSVYRKLSQFTIITKDSSDVSETMLGRYYVDQLKSEFWYPEIFNQDFLEKIFKETSYGC